MLRNAYPEALNPKPSSSDPAACDPSMALTTRLSACWFGVLDGQYIFVVWKPFFRASGLGILHLGLGSLGWVSKTLEQCLKLVASHDPNTWILLFTAPNQRIVFTRIFQSSCFNILLVSPFTNECFGAWGLGGFNYSLHCIPFLRRLNPTELI